MMGITFILLLSAASAAAQGQVPRASFDAEGFPPACGHHADIWGFALDLPSGQCAETYLHGVAQRLGAAGQSERSIVVFAVGNVLSRHSSLESLADYVSTARELASGGVSVEARRAVVVAGVRGDRWRYRYREKATGRERVIDVAVVLRPIRPPREPLDYYEYAFSLETTPELYASDLGAFEALLRTVAFTEPER